MLPRRRTLTWAPVHEQGRGRGYFVRALGGVALLVVPPEVIAAIAIALGLGEREPLDVRVSRIAKQASAAAAPAADPLAWAPASAGSSRRARRPERRT